MSIQSLRASIANLLLRGVVSLVNNDGGVQKVQLKMHDGAQNAERLQNYGHVSYPKQGAEGIVLALSGHRSHSVMIVCDDRRYRLDLEEGESALYDDLGQKVHLKRDGIYMYSPFIVHIEAPESTIKSNTTIDGMLTVNDKITAKDDLSVDGNADVKGTIHSDETVKGENGVYTASNSLDGHHHNLGLVPTSSAVT